MGTGPADFLTGGAYTTFGGGEASGEAPSTSGSIAEQMQALTRYLPKLLEITNQSQTPAAVAQLEAAQATSPAYSQLGLEQLQKFGLPYAQLGQQIQDSNAQAGARTNLAQIEGAGGDAARAADSLAREINPSFYKVSDAASNRSVDLMNSINLNGLSGGERAEVERSLNARLGGSGNLGLDNATNAVTNAMNFGSAIQGKRDALGQAIQVANGTATTAQNTGFNPVGVALSQPQAQTQTNFGTGFFSPVASSATSGASNTANSLLGAINNTATTQMPLQAETNFNNSPMGRMNNNPMLQSCCFIFLESYNGVLPWYVRVERDKYYSLCPEVATGYKKMASWLVPKMKSNKLVRMAVNAFMVKPLTWKGGWTHGVNRFGWMFEPVRWFWFAIWKHS